MSYRFLRITDLYPNYIKSYYSKNSTTVSNSYEEKYNAIAENSIDIVSSFGRCFREIGVDAKEIITNDKVLQKAWTEEYVGDSDLNSVDLVIKQLQYYKPDIVWIDTTSFFHKQIFDRIRNEVKSIKLLVGHICAPFNDIIAEALRSLDVVFTCSPCMRDDIAGLGVETYLLYHSFDSKVLSQLASEPNEYPYNDFVFTGSLLTGYGLHKTRIEYLETLLKNGFDLKIYGNVESKKTIFLKQFMRSVMKSMLNIGLTGIIDNNSFLKKYKKYADAEIKGYSKQLINSVHDPVFGVDMFKVLQHSLVCFNIHGEIAKSCGGNIRLFEATGVGTCLVTDNKKNMPDLFNVGSEIVVYDSKDDCVEKVKWLMNNPVKASEIAKAGQKKTLEEHTVLKRTKELNDFFLTKIDRNEK